MFQDWEEKIKDNPQVSPTLLWEYDLTNFDWQYMRRIVVQRVVERGWMKDFYAIFRLYGGVEGVRKIIKEEIPEFACPRDVALACMLFDLKKEELKCYTWKQLREKRLFS
jgi:hypothetical protein